MATGVASIHPVYTDQVTELRFYATRDGESLLNQSPPVYYRPKAQGNSQLDLHDPNSYGELFDRTPIHEDFRDAIREGGSTGAASDFAVTTIQGDFLATMERAFRARHHTAIRLRTHAAGRRLGQGNIEGVWSKGLSTYLSQLELEGKA